MTIIELRRVRNETANRLPRGSFLHSPADLFDVQCHFTYLGSTLTMMRYLLLAVLIIAPASAQTGISQYPFCIQGFDNPGWSGCSFNTLQACQATASGTESECLSNPWYQPGASVQPPAPVGSQIGVFAPLPVGPPPE